MGDLLYAENHLEINPDGLNFYCCYSVYCLFLRFLPVIRMERLECCNE